MLGYCPQTNCIDDNLTVYQTLELMCALVGIPEAKTKDAITAIANKFTLENFVQTKAGALSGGNKRKLCLAMAMLGRPKVIFIDEASAGVDPGARKMMWKAIADEG